MKSTNYQYKFCTKIIWVFWTLNFGKLLILNAFSFIIRKFDKICWRKKENTKLLIDVSQENKDLPNIEYLEKITLNKKYLNLLAIPASANKNMIKSIMNFYKNSFPSIGLTKLDESHVSAEELSIFAELNCKIGILSGSRSIIGSIAFAKSQVLAQYMKE